MKIQHTAVPKEHFFIGSGFTDSEAWIPDPTLHFVPLRAEDDEFRKGFCQSPTFVTS